MKALEPILKHSFWILLGLAIILPFTGWWMTTGSMQAAITERKEAIKKATELVTSAGEVPGKDWERQLKSINDRQKLLVEESTYSLYDRQKEKMVWPAIVESTAAKLKYRAKFDNIIDRVNFRDNYKKEVYRVYSIPRPIELDQTNGVVDFDAGSMPRRVFGDITPSSIQMWNAMEDLWILEPLLQAVLETNGGVDATPFDSSILAIESLALYGGDRNTIGQNPQATGAQGGGGFSRREKDDDTPSSLSGKVTSKMYSVPDLEIKPTEVFGDAGGATEEQMEEDDNLSLIDEEKQGTPQPQTGGFSAIGEVIGRRYIDNEEGEPFRTRGFIISVVIDHRKIPEFYGQLTSSERSPWPIQIVRMHVARKDDAPKPKSAGGPGGSTYKSDDFLLMVRPNTESGGVPVALGTGFQSGGGRGLGGRRGEDDGNMPEASSFRPDDPRRPLWDNPFLARVHLAGIITLYKEPVDRNPSVSTENLPSESENAAGTLSDESAEDSPSASEEESMTEAEADDASTATESSEGEGNMEAEEQTPPQDAPASEESPTETEEKPETPSEDPDTESSESKSAEKTPTSE